MKKLTLVATIAMTAISLASCGGGDDATTETTSAASAAAVETTQAPETTEAPETISVDVIAVGDCMNLPDDEEFFDVATVDCTQEHDAEVIAVVDLTPVSADFSEGAPYPGDDLVYETAFEECVDDFEAYVGVAYETSELYMDAFTPTPEGWAELSDRVVNCFVFEVNDDASDLVRSTGSLRNAGR